MRAKNNTKSPSDSSWAPIGVIMLFKKSLRNHCKKQYKPGEGDSSLFFVMIFHVFEVCKNQRKKTI